MFEEQNLYSMSKKDQQITMPEIGTYIDPLTDFGFKHLFGREPSKELLINFLNELFKGKELISELSYTKNERSGMRPKSRTMFFDLTCTGKNGEQFIIEVHRIRQKFFKDRAVYYSTGLIQDQAPQDSYWDYSLKKVYFIGIMDFILDDSDVNEYLHWVRLAYEKTGKEFYRKLAFIFIEIPKFTKTETELKTGVDKWLFILKNLSRLNKIPVILNTRIFSKLFHIAEVSNLTKEDYMSYQKDLKASWDEYAIKKTIEDERKEAKEAITKALKEGKERGIREGRKKGIEEGREEGREEGKAEVVRNLLFVGKFSNEEVANFANVSEAFVRKVKKDMK
jgi:predicted transposase/invertase (TIGR01784 family)